ncbi:MAG: bis(5'-nucleosyl)-tetraphosphatase (symmetrical) YqeK [Clostridia bacterium]|nr:bis(5'-nucleosyl)-tetraphosphatase (symmetrical) YqeK [Clostridia bacterium]
MQDKTLYALRETIVGRLGEYRAKHVLSTENEAAELAKIYIPHKEHDVRISALLHDITKEHSTELQLQLLSDFGIMTDNVMLNSPKVFHAITAPLIIKRDFPEYATDEILSSVRKHTTGSSDMSVFDCIIYLADYIEPGRTFSDCKELREYFWSGIKNCKGERDKLMHLYKTMVLSFDLTINNLVSEHCVIASDTFSARNAFLMKISEEN